MFNATRGRNNEDESYYTKANDLPSSQGSVYYDKKPRPAVPNPIYSSSSYEEFQVPGSGSEHD
ncbi:MAG: hypothetical protein ACAI35_05845 [Candidatus Methylacidiphilales bacterium]|nr:hypothetical protein [Candidatus Methylacidiphilales bacterium]